MESPRINVTKPLLPPMEEYVKEIAPLWENGILTHQGPKHNELSQKLSEFLNVKNIMLFANGHLALEVIFKAMGLEGEVITTPFTFASTTQAIIRAGLKPVFCDIEPDFYTMNPDKIESLITKKTCAIVPVHVYGNICNVEAIESIAKRHGLKVIYDAAHTFGIEYNGKGIGEYGDASMFSFHATKVFNTVEGGGITYSDSSLTPIIHAIRQFGQTDECSFPYIGTNAKMTEMHACMGLCNLRHISEAIESRQCAAERYRERLGESQGIKLCATQHGVKQNYAYFPVVFDKDKFKKSRDEVAMELQHNNIYARKYFYPLTNEFECLGEGYSKDDTPVAADISRRVLTLPLYAGLSISDVDRICDIILNK